MAPSYVQDYVTVKSVNGYGLDLYDYQPIH